MKPNLISNLLSSLFQRGSNFVSPNGSFGQRPDEDTDSSGVHDLVSPATTDNNFAASVPPSARAAMTRAGHYNDPLLQNIRSIDAAGAGYQAGMAYGTYEDLAQGLQELAWMFKSAQMAVASHYRSLIDRLENAKLKVGDSSALMSAEIDLRIRQLVRDIAETHREIEQADAERGSFGEIASRYRQAYARGQRDNEQFKGLLDQPGDES